MARRTHRDDAPEDTATTRTLHMPATPPDTPDFPAGRHVLEAQQQAERDIASGALDVSYVEAGEGPLPSQQEIRARAQLRKEGARQQAASAEAIATALLQDAEQGLHTTPPRGMRTSRVRRARSRSLSTARSESEAAAAALADADATHRNTVDVLEGKRATPDGENRAGAPIAPGTRYLLLAIVLALVAEYALLAIPLLIEGSIVAENMHVYFGTDDANPWVPFTIAAVTVLSLTVVPFLVGRQLNHLLHGGHRHILRWIAIGAGLAIWLYAGVTLAQVRVAVDRDAALDRAERRYRQAVEDAQAAGIDPATVPTVVPDEVFDPTLPLLMWFGILLGIGIALMIWEIFRYNPARLEELRARLARSRAEERALVLDDYIGRVEADVAAQRAANEAAATEWELELSRIDAEARLCERTYEVALVQASGSPEMAMAIENRRGVTDAAPATETAEEER